MIPLRWKLTALLGGLLIGGTAAAQDRAAPEERKRPPAEVQELYENIEVLRRILASNLRNLELTAKLHESCVQCHGPGTTASNKLTPFRGLRLDLPGTPADDALLHLLHHARLPESLLPAPDVEGVYLAGQGVVYTVTLPPPTAPLRAPPTVTPPPGRSEWDRIRRQLRGDKETTPSEPPAAERDLADVILGILAEHGRHFTMLKDGESLTVVITFRTPRRTPAMRTTSLQGGAALFTPVAGQGGLAGVVSPPVTVAYPSSDPFSGGRYTPAVPRTGTSSAPPPAQGGGNPESPSSPRDYELLGQLHLKQGRAAQAVQAFEQALAAYETQPVTLPSNTKTDEARRLLEERQQKVRELYVSLAQALLAQGKYDEASRLVEKLRNPEKLSVKVATVPAVLPTRLIVALPRSVLLQSGLDKLSPAELKKAARVERLDFGADEKPAAKTNK